MLLSFNCCTISSETFIQAPDLETRIAILGLNAEYRGIKIPSEVIDFIAHQVTSNIRELEGALLRVLVYTSMNQEDLTPQTAAKALSDVFTPSDINLTMNDILRITANHFDLEPGKLKSKGRRRELVVARQVAMYLIRELTPHSYPEIGQFFSGRDHSTVMYAVQKIEEQTKDTTNDLHKKILEIKEELF